MGKRLDAAAVRSAHTVLTVSRTPFMVRLRRRGAFARQMVGIAWEAVEPQVEQHLRGSAAADSSAAESSDTNPRDPDSPDTDTDSPAGQAPDGQAPDGQAPDGRITARSVPPHTLIHRPVDVESHVGDDERCTCRGDGDDWCGATRGEVVYDLMERGMRLTREQAEAIWAEAQHARRVG